MLQEYVLLTPGIVITFENPALTTEQQKVVIDRTLEESKEHNYDCSVYLAHNHNILFEHRQKIYNNQYGCEIVKPSSARNLIQALEELNGKYKNVGIVLDECFEARIREEIEEFNGKNYNFNKIYFVTEKWQDVKDFASGAWGITKDVASAGWSLTKEAGSAAIKVAEILADAMNLALVKYPLVGWPVVMFLTFRKMRAKERKKDLGLDPYDPELRNAFLEYKKDEFELIRDNRLDKLSSYAAEMYRKRGYDSDKIKRAIESGKLEDMEAVFQKRDNKRHPVSPNPPPLNESISVSRLNDSIQSVSRMQNLSFEDKANLVNALLAIRTQQYKTADEILNKVSDSARIMVLSQLGMEQPPNSDVPMNIIRRFQAVSPLDKAMNSIPAMAYDKTADAVGWVAGRAANKLTFGAFDKYVKLTTKKDDIDDLKARVKKLESGN